MDELAGLLPVAIIVNRRTSGQISPMMVAENFRNVHIGSRTTIATQKLFQVFCTEQTTTI